MSPQHVLKEKPLANSKTILLISPEPWTALAVSKHHYARTLCARGHQVLFLDPPIQTGQPLRITPVSDQSGLYSIQAPPVMRGLRYVPKWLREKLEARWLARLERAFGTTINVVWLFENSRFYDMSFSGLRLRIYHQVDVNQDFHAAAAARSADICLCTSDAIARRLRPHSRQVIKIEHGYAETAQTPVLPSALEGHFDSHSPHLVYIGSFDIRYLRNDLLDKATALFPDATFHFVGSHSEATPLFQVTRNRSNVRWWGHVASDLIPAILARSDVLLLAYDAEASPDQLSNPHKLMQYMGSGKVIVATWTEEYADKTHLLEMVRHGDDFLPRLSDTLANLDRLNAPERMAARIAFARAHSYSKQLDRIETALDKLGLSLKKTSTP